jgi:hypothetical protein
LTLGDCGPPPPAPATAIPDPPSADSVIVVFLELRPQVRSSAGPVTVAEFFVAGRLSGSWRNGAPSE